MTAIECASFTKGPRSCALSGAGENRRPFPLAIAVSIGIATLSMLLAPGVSYASEATHVAAIPARAIENREANAAAASASLAMSQPKRPESIQKVDVTASKAPAPDGMVRLPGHVLAALAKAKLLPPKPGEENDPLSITVVLKRTDQAGFDRYLNDVYDPKSPRFLHFLTQREITARFGPSRKAYKDVLAYLRKNGFKLTEGSKNRMTLTVRGTRAQAERAFSVRIRDYESGGRRFFANEVDPAIESSFAAEVGGVIGLTNLAVPAPSGSARCPPVGLPQPSPFIPRCYRKP